MALAVDRGGRGVSAADEAHEQTVERVWEAVGSTAAGLSEAEARERLAAAPAVEERRRVSVVAEEIGEALTEPLQLLLIAVGVLSALFGEVRNAVAIFAIVALVAAVEAISEMRATRALRALSRLTAPGARVRRGGIAQTIGAAGVVVGDVIELAAGDIAAADARVVAADGLAIDESALTGEPVAVGKGPAAVARGAPLAERSSMVYAGTAVVAGAGAAVAVTVGADTEAGRLGRLAAKAAQPPTPLQRAMAELARAALLIAVAASVLVPLIGVLRGQPLRQMVLEGLTLAFATIPEELPILVTVLVAVGGMRLARRGVLLRRLRAAEAAGGVSVLVSDKTGTLTENRLRLDAVDGEPEHVLAAAVAALGDRPAQDPIDRALAEAADAAGAPPAGHAVRRFPFDPARKRESAIWRGPDRCLVAVKGAPEAVLAVCAIPDDDRRRALARADALARAGRRVIAVATGHLPHPPHTVSATERDLSFAGLVAFLDPLRSGVPDAVTTLASAGVRTIVVTGDHPSTAAAVAQEAGLDGGDVLLGGAALEALGDEELAARLGGASVIARATPADKLRVVRVLQATGEAVAVTGDGVNDAPALAAANVGIAMGRRGTDLAREAADLVLTDDAYPTIATAVAAGRSLSAQLRRAVAFYLGAKIALVATVAVPLALGLPSPFDPVQIVLLELFMDLGASVAFVSEPAAPLAMRRGPRDPAARFLDRAQVLAIATTATALTAATLPAYLVTRPLAGDAVASASAFAAWLLAHAAIAWSLRAQPGLRWSRNVAFPAWAATAAATAALVTLTPAGAAIGIERLTAAALAVTCAAAALGATLAAAARRGFSQPLQL